MQHQIGIDAIVDMEPIRSLPALLAECSVSHVESRLGDATLASLHARHEEGRTAFLAHLKASGVDALKDEWWDESLTAPKEEAKAEAAKEAPNETKEAREVIRVLAKRE